MDPFLGEIRLMAFGLIPKGWAACDGSILQVSTHQALYSLLGNYYGGTGPTTFALPDLRGRVPQALNTPGGQTLGNAGGVEAVALTATQMPVHNHLMYATTVAADKRNGQGTILATAPISLYNSPQPGATTLNPGSVASTGGGQPHPNMQPFLVLNFYIATTGIYPPRP